MAAVAAQNAKRRSRRQQLEEQRAFQAEHEERMLVSWLATHDMDGDGALDRSEFANLVRGLDGNTESAVDDLAIDRLFAKARNGKTALTVTKPEIKEAVIRYREYLVHHDYLDSIMEQFDTDKNGTLDRKEIKRMLETILRDGAKLTVNEKGREYKLRALESAYQRGLLDKQASVSGVFSSFVTGPRGRGSNYGRTGTWRNSTASRGGSRAARTS